MLTDADRPYIAANYVTLEELCADSARLLMLPRPGSEDWRVALREQVEELDSVERDFAPDWDRAARERYPELFHA